MVDWSEVPAYKQVADALRQKIHDEGLKPGDALPSIAELMATHDVSITPVRMAIRDLRKEGLVRTVGGKGNFVGSGRPEGTPEFEQVMRQVGAMQQCIDELHARLEAVEGQLGVQPAPAASPTPPTGRRGRP